MPSLRHLTVVALAAITFTGCAPITAGSYGQRGIDFAQFRTYDWGPPDALPTGDPRLDANPFFEDHFEGAVERQLARKGFGRVSERPDLVVQRRYSLPSIKHAAGRRTERAGDPPRARIRALDRAWSFPELARDFGATHPGRRTDSGRICVKHDGA